MGTEFNRSYNFSTDYGELFDLLTNGYAVVCYVTWVFSHYDNGEPMMATDVCEAKYIDADNPKYAHYLVGCRGTSFIDVAPYQKKWYNMSMKDIFIKNCEAHELKYIKPVL